jgi:hypothetical protein
VAVGLRVRVRSAPRWDAWLPVFAPDFEVNEPWLPPIPDDAIAPAGHARWVLIGGAMLLRSF